MIRFLYGESGFEKSVKISDMLRKDAENGIHSFLIVPEQQAVASERMILYRLPPSAQLTMEVLNFSRLYNRVCREYGGLEYDYATKPAKYLLMWQTVRELSPMLEHYGKSGTTDAALTEFMLGAVGEFKANGVGSAELERAAEKLEDNAELYAKLRDLSLIFSAYNAAVSEKFSDSADDVSKLSDILKAHNFFRNSHVYIDSFTSFTAAEHAVIERIFAQADEISVSIPLPSPRYEALYTATISASERKLIRSAEPHGGHTALLPETTNAYRTPAISYLSDKLWNMTDTTPMPTPEEETDSSVVFEVCQTPYAEAEAAARHTLELMRSGYRCRDIVVITRDAENYRGIIEPAFERNGIPFFFSEKSDLCSKSIVKFILSALRIKDRSWQANDVILHLKTGLYDIPSDAIDMFESYVGTWNIRGRRFLDEYWSMNPDGYRTEMSDRARNILSAANEVKRTLCDKLIPLFARLDAADNAREMCIAIYEFLIECEVETRLSEVARRYAAVGNLKEAEEYSALWGVTLNALSLCADLLEEREISSEELSGALKMLFDVTEIGTIPTSADEVVIGSASTLRASEPRCVIVLGLCEGEFPKSISDVGVLNTPERTILSELGVELSANAETKSSDELLFVKRAFAMPTDRLILMTHKQSADGGARQHSLAYLRARKLLPHINEHSFDEYDMEYLCGSAAGAAQYTVSPRTGDTNIELRKALLSLGEKFSYLASSPSRPVSNEICKIEREALKEAFPEKMTFSQSKLERYVKCNFSYYCYYLLGLRPEGAADFGSSEMGTFVHFLLEALIKEVIDDGGVKDGLSDDTLVRLTDEVIARYIEQVAPAEERAKGSFTHLYLRLRNLSLILIKNIVEEFSHSRFLPKHFEHRIGANGTAPLEFTLSDGNKVSLSGVVDRIDIYKNDGKVYIRVVDYKTGTKDFSLDDLSLGLNTQMLIYLFSLCSDPRFVAPHEHAVPAGVIYLSSNIPTMELEDYTDADEVLSAAAKGFSRSGLLLDNEDILEAMNDEFSSEFLAGIKKKSSDGTLSGKALASAKKFDELQSEIEQVIVSIVDSIKNGCAYASPLEHDGVSPCEFCDMRPVCRKNKEQ